MQCHSATDFPCHQDLIPWSLFVTAQLHPVSKKADLMRGTFYVAEMAAPKSLNLER